MSLQFCKLDEGLLAPQGFRVSAVSCAIKDPDKMRPDLALIYSEDECSAAGTFTTNRVKAAPVRLSKIHLSQDQVQAVLVNSGNANACTGPQGGQDSKTLVRAVAKGLGLRQRQIANCSTGIIGVPLPMERILPKIPELVDGLRGGRSHEVAEAIMTSDTKPKEIAIEVEINGRPVRVGAVAKGAGMIAPSMATMLCFVTTDFAIEEAELRRVVQCVVDETFNCIVIDGDTSTNDTVIVLANGRAGNRRPKPGGPAVRKFNRALTHVCREMAKAIVADGERVTKFVEVQVKGARTWMDARKVAETVANSPLCKASWNGEDANWGRILCAIGRSRAQVREEHVAIYFNGKLAAKHGMAADTDPGDLREVVRKREFTITIDLNLGSAGHTIYTSDLSPEYVDFNRSEYAMWKKMQA